MSGGPDAADAQRLLITLRMGVGVGGWVAPGLLGRFFGADPRMHPAVPFFGRLFAVRDAALAAGLMTADGRDRDRWLVIGMACDAADAAASAVAGMRRQIPRPVAALTVVTASAAVALGARARG